ncbi:hypothetical protein Tco_0375674 [Tanacetum coccineum]
MVAEKLIISETIVKVDSQMMIQKNDVCSQQFRPQTSMSNDVCSQQFRPQTSMSNDVVHNSIRTQTSISYALSWKPCQGDSLNLPDHRAQVDQGSQIKMIQVKEMMQDNDLKNSKSKDKGSKSRSQSMNEQSHYKQDKTITRQSINVKSHVFNVIVSETTPKLPEVVGKGKAIVTDEQIAHSLIDLSKKKRTTDQFILVRRDQAPHDSTTGPSSQPEDNTSEKVVQESSSTTDSKGTESKTEAAAPKDDKEQGEVSSSTVTSGVGTYVRTEDQAGSDPGKAHEALEDTPYLWGIKFLYDKPTEDEQEKSKVIDESDSTIPDPSHQTVTSPPPVIAPVIDFSSPKPSSQVTPPPINTEATTITTSLPEITPFIALQLRVAKLEQDMSEYLGTKLDDALLRVLERHTADLIEKYSVLPGPESIKNQESKKSPKEIIRIKREQGEKEQESTLPSDEDAMDKEVKDRVKDHKRKHDSDDDEDDDHQTRVSQQKGEDTIQVLLGQLNLLLKMMSKVRRNYMILISEPESGHSEHSSDDVSKQDEGHVSDLEDTDNAHIPKNNWANAYATSYQVPAENKLQRKTYDIGSFIKWFCRRTGKKKLCKADLEGPAFNLVKAFHKNNVLSH